ncbi:MAG: hypothetical protein QHC79_25790 [Pseudosphingobacterium sp.]|nr:hypothetical protein [Pseudosphingobacterium sp.]
MNEQNFDYLKKQQKYMEVGDRLHEVLERAISKGLPKFDLAITASHPVLGDTSGTKRDFARYQLEYSRSAKSDDYYLNANNVTLYMANEPFPRTQRFDLQHFPQFTLTEAYNLLSGRAVEKLVPKRDDKGELIRDDQGKAVLQPVFYKIDTSIKDAYNSHPVRPYYPGYKFDLEQTLANYRPENIKASRKDEDPLKSLRRGDFIEATIPIGKKKTDVYMAADPEWKSMEVYDKKGVLVHNKTIFPELQEKKNDQKASKEASANQAKDQTPEWQNQQSYSEENTQKRTAGVSR